MTFRTRRRRGTKAALISTAMVATVLLVAPAGASNDTTVPDPITMSASTLDPTPTPRDEDPPGCNGVNQGMDTYLQVTKVRVRRGDNNAIIGDFTLPSFTSDFSLGDKIVVREMKITDQNGTLGVGGCDFDNADFVVGVYQDGTGIPGNSVSSANIHVGASMTNGATATYSPNWSYVTGTGNDHDVGNDLFGASDPPGDQIGIIGVIDVGLNAGLPHMGECGLAGATLHNADLEGTGCSVSVHLFTLYDPVIQVKKRAFIWNGTNPKVYLDGSTIKVNGKFLKDGKSVVKPGKKVFYLYEVFNPGPINDLTTVIDANDDECNPIEPVEIGNTSLGDTNSDGELDVGESFFFICDVKLNATLDPGTPYELVTNTVSFEFGDRNGNSTGDVGDDFSVYVGYTCFGKLVTTLGTSGDDTIDGTPGNDVIYSMGGNDTVNGKDGKDRICLGSGNDEGNGGAGKDKIKGQGGGDDLSGGKGDDVLKGGGGTDSADGGGGIDKCVAEVESKCEL